MYVLAISQCGPESMIYCHWMESPQGRRERGAVSPHHAPSTILINQLFQVIIYSTAPVHILLMKL